MKGQDMEVEKMELMEAMQERHSVRSYTEQKMEGETLDNLQEFVRECNQESGMHIQLLTDEPEAFTGMMVRYGNFKNVRNYIALVGKKNAALDEMGGYYGEKIVLKAQQLGLNTCWVAMTFNKRKAKRLIEINRGEKLLMVISLGYGVVPGVPHRSKKMGEVCRVQGDMPKWFRDGVEAALLAPTAVNQQKFQFELVGDTVKATAGSGFYSKVDLGIVKYHFEIGAGEHGVHWLT